MWGPCLSASGGKRPACHRLARPPSRGHGNHEHAPVNSAGYAIPRWSAGTGCGHASCRSSPRSRHNGGYGDRLGPALHRRTRDLSERPCTRGVERCRRCLRASHNQTGVACLTRRPFDANPIHAVGTAVTAGDAVPGFLVARSEAPTEWALEGEHLFSRYGLTFRIAPVDSGQCRVAAHSVRRVSRPSRQDIPSHGDRQRWPRHRCPPHLAINQDRGRTQHRLNIERPSTSRASCISRVGELLDLRVLPYPPIVSGGRADAANVLEAGARRPCPRWGR